ncbi:hypothetical protein KKH56_01815 [bacterium]|nr:hypothetical protein [bacterium]
MATLQKSQYVKGILKNAGPVEGEVDIVGKLIGKVVGRVEQTAGQTTPAINGKAEGRASGYLLGQIKAEPQTNMILAEQAFRANSRIVVQGDRNITEVMRMMR